MRNPSGAAGPRPGPQRSRGVQDIRAPGSPGHARGYSPCLRATMRRTSERGNSRRSAKTTGALLPTA